MDDKLAAVAAGQGDDWKAAVGATGSRPTGTPSKPWFGGLILGCLTLAAVWVLTYTLAPLPGQESLGGWNYVAVGTLLTAFIGLSKAWHGEPPQRPGASKSS